MSCSRQQQSLARERRHHLLLERPSREETRGPEHRQKRSRFGFKAAYNTVLANDDLSQILAPDLGHDSASLAEELNP